MEKSLRSMNQDLPPSRLFSIEVALGRKDWLSTPSICFTSMEETLPL
jgi:hypothetical protein